MYRKFLVLLAVFFFSVVYVQAGNPFFQDKEEWFRTMAAQRKFDIDPSAVAVILYEKCTYDLQSGFQVDNYLSREVRQIIKIVKKGGVQYGDIRILYHSAPGDRVEIKGVKGSTYKLVGNDLIKNSLNSDDITRDNTDYLIQKRFSMPAVEEGAVLDISYTISAPTTLLFAEWDFQHAVPTLYSELEVWVPSLFPYLTMKQGISTGFREFNDSRRSLASADVPESYMFSEVTASPDVRHERWVRRNIPALVDEPMAPAGVVFQEHMQLRINTVQIGNIAIGVMDNWKKVNEALYEGFHYLKPVYGKYPSIKEQTELITTGITDPLEKAKAIYRYVRSTMQVKGYTGIYTRDEMDKLLTNKNGSSSEINFLLLTMLHYANIEGQPIAISTTEQRRAMAEFPDINQFNQTICQVTIGGKKILLDASSHFTPFGQLPREDYNGYSRVIMKEGGELTLDPASLSERSLITINTKNADPKDYVINVAYTFGPIEAAKRRMEWQKDTSTLNAFIKPAVSKAGMDARLVEYGISGLANPDTSLTVSFSMRLTWPEDGKAYFNPHFMSSVTENPFHASSRSMPVELPAMQDAFINLKLQLPEGYKIEDSPKPAVVNMNTNDYYRYLLAYDAAQRTLQISTRMHMERTWYPPSDYSLIKQFYEKIISQQQATYVFSK